MIVTFVSMMFTVLVGYFGISFFIEDPTPIETIRLFYNANDDNWSGLLFKITTLLPIALAGNGLFWWLIILKGVCSLMKDKLLSSG